MLSTLSSLVTLIALIGQNSQFSSIRTSFVLLTSTP